MDARIEALTRRYDRQRGDLAQTRDRLLELLADDIVERMTELYKQDPEPSPVPIPTLGFWLARPSSGNGPGHMVTTVVPDEAFAALRRRAFEVGSRDQVSDALRQALRRKGHRTLGFDSELSKVAGY